MRLTEAEAAAMLPGLAANPERSARGKRVAVEGTEVGENFLRSLDTQCQSVGITAGCPQFRWKDSAGHWRWFDRAWPGIWLALEFQGGIWKGGAHAGGKGYIADCDRMADAVLLGWRLLYATREHIDSGRALGWIERAFALAGKISTGRAGECSG